MAYPACLAPEQRPAVLQIIFSNDEAKARIDRNPRSALKLGHARGAAVVAALHSGLAIVDYTPRRVKQCVAGYGQAEKSQVQAMVRTLLALDSPPSQDAADALAVAICHAHHAAAGGRLRT